MYLLLIPDRWIVHRLGVEIVLKGQCIGKLVNVLWCMRRHHVILEATVVTLDAATACIECKHSC